MKTKLHICLLIALAAVSCKTAGRLHESTTELFRGEIIAKVGDHRLHRAELERYIPSGVSPEDSAALARQYIQSWAEDLLLMEMAETQLSKKEKDVSAELEEYRKTLIKYRYEQLYIQQRLDTLVTEEEVVNYYQENQDRFRLDRPIVKARYMIIPSDARSLKIIKSKMSSDDELEVVEADSLAASVALKYVDASETWTDALVLAREAVVDYRAFLGAIKGPFVEIGDETGNLHVIYIADMLPEGKTAPIEYCSDRIRDLILSSRKHALEEGLVQDLLDNARKNNQFVIYDDEK